MVTDQGKDWLRIEAPYCFTLESIVLWLVFTAAFSLQNYSVSLCLNFEFRQVLHYSFVRMAVSIFVQVDRSANNRIADKRHVRKDYFRVHCSTIRWLITDPIF
jgi:hypothetical protein